MNSKYYINVTKNKCHTSPYFNTGTGLTIHFNGEQNISDTNKGQVQEANKWPFNDIYVRNSTLSKRAFINNLDTFYLMFSACVDTDTGFGSSRRSLSCILSLREEQYCCTIAGKCGQVLAGDGNYIAKKGKLI